MSDRAWIPRTPEEYRQATRELRDLCDQLRESNARLREQLGHCRESHAANHWTLRAERDR